MAKLPPLVTGKLNAAWPEDWAINSKNFFSNMGQAVRKRVALERIKEKEVEEKGKTD